MLGRGVSSLLEVLKDIQFELACQSCQPELLMADGSNVGGVVKWLPGFATGTGIPRLLTDAVETDQEFHFVSNDSLERPLVEEDDSGGCSVSVAAQLLLEQVEASNDQPSQLLVVVSTEELDSRPLVADWELSVSVLVVTLEVARVPLVTVVVVLREEVVSAAVSLLAVVLMVVLVLALALVCLVVEETIPVEVTHVLHPLCEMPSW